MKRRFVIIAFVAASLGGAAPGQVSIGSSSVNNHVSASVSVFSGGAQSKSTLLNPATIQPIQVSHHVDLAGNVAEAVLLKSSSNMFVCVGAWSPPTGDQASASMFFTVKNLSPSPVWFSATGFINLKPPLPSLLPQRQFSYFNGSTGRSVDFANQGGFAFEDQLMAGGTAWITAAAFSLRNTFAESSAQVVASISINPTQCPRQSVATNATGVVFGQGGLPPILSFVGCANSGPVSIELSLARPDAASVLVVGVPGPGLPVLGGILWPASFVAVPIVTGAASMGFGGWKLPVSLPAGTLGSLALQSVVADPAAIQGVSFSNALTVTLN